MAERDDLGLHRGLSSESGKGAEHEQYEVGHGPRSLPVATRNFNDYNADRIFGNDN
jgi:hypothetical protein